MNAQRDWHSEPEPAGEIRRPKALHDDAGTGAITRVGDEMVRCALYEAANALLTRVQRFSALKRWGLEVAKRRGAKRAKVALARKMAVIMHRMWVDNTAFRWAAAAT